MKPQPVFEVDILAEGRAALEKANRDLGESVTLSKLPPRLFLFHSPFSCPDVLYPSSFLSLLFGPAVPVSTPCLLLHMFMPHDTVN